MDYRNPYTANSNFVDLLTRQQPSVIHEPIRYESVSHGGELGSSQLGSTQLGEDKPPERKERKKWTPSDDLVLMSSWLNTSKDAVVGNEQKSDCFWRRIAAYYAASSKTQSGDKPEPIQCKQSGRR